MKNIKIQQCIKHIKTMFYTVKLAVSLKKIRTFVDKLKLKYKRIKIHKDMIDYQLKLPLIKQSKNIEQSQIFFTRLFEYITTNKDTAEFHENGNIWYDQNNKTYHLGCQWKTHSFCLDFTNVYVDNGIWLEFTFNIYQVWKEESGIYNGSMKYKTIKEYQPTGLIFYVNYVGEQFNIKSNYHHQSHESSDYGYVTNLIAYELVKDLENKQKPNR